MNQKNKPRHFLNISLSFLSQLVALNLEFKLVQNQSTQLRNRMKDFSEESVNTEKYIFFKSPIIPCITDGIYHCLTQDQGTGEVLRRQMAGQTGIIVT